MAVLWITCGEGKKGIKEGANFTLAIENSVYSVYNRFMTRREIIARLESEGWVRVHIKGSHHQYKHPEKPGRVTVKHPEKDIPIGTLRNIYRQVGWSWS